MFGIGMWMACTTVGITENGEKQTTEEQDCSVAINSTIPVPNANDVYYRSSIHAVLSAEDMEATISLALDGEEIEGEQALVGSEIVFTPKEPLLPSREYQVLISYCGSTEPVSFSFQTSDLGTELDGGNAILRNRSYMVDLGQGRVITPVGVGDYLQSILENTFLFDVQDVQSEEVFLRIGLSMSDSEEQNFCVPTIEDFPLVDLRQAPYFNMYGSYVPIVIGSYRMSIYDIEVTGTIRSDASSFHYMEARGFMDLREVYPVALDFNVNMDSVDEFTQGLESLGVEIVACADGELYCTPLVIDSLMAEEIARDITPVCEPNCHQNCTENYDTCTTPQVEDLAECPQ